MIFPSTEVRKGGGSVVAWIVLSAVLAGGTSFFAFTVTIHQGADSYFYRFSVQNENRECY